MAPKQPLIQRLSGFFLEVKWAGLEVNHLLLSNANVTNEWGYISTSSIYFHGVEKENYLVKSLCGPKAITYNLCHIHFNVIILETNYDHLNSAQFVTIRFFNIRIYF